jgi:hypothetical protein
MQQSSHYFIISQKLGKSATQVERLGQISDPEWKDRKPKSGKESPM